MLAHDKAIIHSSDESDWRTPPDLVAALRREFRFVLDAAADASASVCGPYQYLGPGSPVAENALLVPWQVDEVGDAIFLNPPFSRQKAAALRKAKQRVAARSYDIAAWAEKCWHESRRGVRIVSILPFAPQTAWYRRYVYGHIVEEPDPADPSTLPRVTWAGHAAKEERRLPQRISFLRPDGSPAANAGVNSVVVIWDPMHGAVGPWTPMTWYWSWK